MRLAIELYGARLGTLEDDVRTFDFTPTQEGLDRFGVNSPILSVSIPLNQRPRRDHAQRRRNWFNELLPEGSQLDLNLQESVPVVPANRLRILLKPPLADNADERPRPGFAMSSRKRKTSKRFDFPDAFSPTMNNWLPSAKSSDVKLRQLRTIVRW